MNRSLRFAGIKKTLMKKWLLKKTRFRLRSVLIAVVLVSAFIAYWTARSNAFRRFDEMRHWTSKGLVIDLHKALEEEKGGFALIQSYPSEWMHWKENDSSFGFAANHSEIFYSYWFEESRNSNGEWGDHDVLVSIECDLSFVGLGRPSFTIRDFGLTGNDYVIELIQSSIEREYSIRARVVQTKRPSAPERSRN